MQLINLNALPKYRERTVELITKKQSPKKVYIVIESYEKYSLSFVIAEYGWKIHFHNKNCQQVLTSFFRIFGFKPNKYVLKSKEYHVIVPRMRKILYRYTKYNSGRIPLDKHSSRLRGQEAKKFMDLASDMWLSQIGE